MTRTTDVEVLHATALMLEGERVTFSWYTFDHPRKDKRPRRHYHSATGMLSLQTDYVMRDLVGSHGRDDYIAVCIDGYPMGYLDKHTWIERSP